MKAQPNARNNWLQEKLIDLLGQTLGKLLILFFEVLGITFRVLGVAFWVWDKGQEMIAKRRRIP